MDFFNLFYFNAIDAFLTVGVFVAVTLLIIELINFKYNNLIIKKLEQRGKKQILFSSLLGSLPGCGGALLITTLYNKNIVSFGSLVAAFIATMGDAAFIILLGSPKIYFFIFIISNLVGVITGYLLDKFNIGNNFITNKTNINKEHCHKENISQHKTNIFNIWKFLFWIFIFCSFPLAIEHITEGHEHLHDTHSLLELIPFLGTLFSIIYIGFKNKFSSPCDNHCHQSLTLKKIFSHIVDETSFLITWVFISFIIYEVLVHLSIGENNLAQLASNNSYLVIIIAILFGLIPGCGPQILIASLYIADIIPFSALIANAICNDGDALFPLIAMNKKSAFWVTLYNVIPAFLIGTFIYFIEKL
ncbi:putative manganese transporter [Cetobacterium sp. SF1]|uniref:putative manganese transporter n=1 Tax=unclassified Cetobacterium TaxID=2630983 RepID=UPI003CF9DB34